MVFGLVLNGLRRGKVRFACAVAGVAVAVGAVVFVFSLAATNAAQAPSMARRAAAPWGAWRVDGVVSGRRAFGRPAVPPPRDGARGTRREAQNTPAPDLSLPVVALTVDFRPGGRVLQGPPMRALAAPAPSASPYEAAPLEEGRWVDDASGEPEVVATRDTLRRFARGKGVAIGDTVNFVGERGTMSARLVGYLAATRLPAGFPDVFANAAAFSRLADERHGSIALWHRVDAVTSPGVPQDGLLTPDSEEVCRAFRSDSERRMDYARPLMLIASVLTALALLVNTLLLSVEANRRAMAILRTVGLTRLGVVRLVAAEALTASLVGLFAGIVAAALGLRLYVTMDSAAFPAGMAFDWHIAAMAALFALAVALAATLFALRPALSVRAMEAAAVRPRRRRRGMAFAFAAGFAAFVAVEVWGASLMRAFVPSPEWPDAIVSLLPTGASAFDIEKLRGIEGVRRISELYPLQIPCPAPGLAHEGAASSHAEHGTRGARPGNVLMLAAEWLPEFRFVEGDHDSCAKALAEGDACVISLMLSRALGLHRGDSLTVEPRSAGRRSEARRIPIVGVVDLNWHMVTSRGLLRGLNGAPQMTLGPAFVSFDTLESLDARPAPFVRMTHIWVEYEPQFLAEHGVFEAGRIVEREIARALGESEEYTVRLHARDEIADGTLAHGTDVIGEAARVPFVFLVILCIGFVAMLVADADALRREYAVLRAVGATRAQLTRRLALNAVWTALAGMAIGLPTGAFFGWYAATVTASHWAGLPHYFAVPWRVVAEGAVGSLVAALAVAVPAAAAIVARETRR